MNDFDVHDLTYPSSNSRQTWLCVWATHSAVDAFVRGDPEPLKDLYSRSDDVDHRQPF